MFTINCKALDWQPCTLLFMWMLWCTGQNLRWTLSFSSPSTEVLFRIHKYIPRYRTKCKSLYKCRAMKSNEAHIYCSLFGVSKIFPLSVKSYQANLWSRFQIAQDILMFTHSCKLLSKLVNIILRNSEPQWTDRIKAH